MTKEQITYSIDKYGLENLFYIGLNNAKRFVLLDETNPTKNYAIFNHTQGLLEMYDHASTFPAVDCVPYDFVENLVFKTSTGFEDAGTQKRIRIIG